MREESQLDAMRSAIRGDFERLAERRGEQELMRIDEGRAAAEDEQSTGDDTLQQTVAGSDPVAEHPLPEPRSALEPNPEPALELEPEPEPERDSEPDPDPEPDPEHEPEPVPQRVPEPEPRRSWLDRLLGR